MGDINLIQSYSDISASNLPPDVKGELYLVVRFAAAIDGILIRLDRPLLAVTAVVIINTLVAVDVQMTITNARPAKK